MKSGTYYKNRKKGTVFFSFILTPSMLLATWVVGIGRGRGLFNLGPWQKHLKRGPSFMGGWSDLDGIPVWTRIVIANGTLKQRQNSSHIYAYSG